ncbi:MAG: translocation/assembly module TamB domain-containing protein [Prevotella sp.]|jgi:hypothetical protein
MRKYLKWGGIAIGIPVLLIIILCLLFYIPPIQRWAVNEVTAYASEEMDMQISIDHVSLKFPLDLSLEEVKVLQPNDSLKNITDTVAYIGEVVADVQLLPLFSKQVMIDELTFNHVIVNTGNLIAFARIKGNVGHFSVQAHGINLGKELVNVNNALLSDATLNIELSDTVPPDTTSSSTNWKIRLVKLKAKNADFTIHMPGDTMAVNAYLGDVNVRNTYLDLQKSLYTVAHLDWDKGRLKYDLNYEPQVNGLDYNHLSLDGLKLKIDSLSYGGSGMNAKISKVAFIEKSGLAVDDFHGKLSMDSTRFSVPDMYLETKAGTTLALDYKMDLNAFDDSLPGHLDAKVRGQLGKQDLMIFAGDGMPHDMKRQWPNKPLVVVAEVYGNMQKMRLKNLNMNLPGALKLKANGIAENLADSSRLSARMNIDAQSKNLDFVKAMLDKDTRQTLQIPEGIVLNGDVKVNGSRYAANFIASQGGGTLRGGVDFDALKTAYNVKLNAHALPLQNFLPKMQLHPFTGMIDAHGAGTDMMSPRTSLTAKAKIENFMYGDYNLNHINADATIRNGRIMANVDSRNPLIDGKFTVDALTKGKRFRGTVFGDFKQLDLYGLHVVDEPLTVATCAHLDLSSDLKKLYHVQGSLSDITLKDTQEVYRPKNVEFDLFTSADTTHAIVESGDFTLNMGSAGGYEQLLDNSNGFLSELQSQLKNKHIDQPRLRERLPNARIFLYSGKDNIVVHLLNHYGYGLSSAFMDLESSPLSGLNGDVYVDSLLLNGFQVDTVRFGFSSSEAQTTYFAQLRNRKGNPQYVFNAFLDGSINEKGTFARTRVYDENDSLGVRLALQASMQEHGTSIHFTGDKPIIGYKEFSVNDSNYIYLGDDQRVKANMALQAADGMGIQIYSNDENTEALQDITIGTRHFDIGEALAMIPFTPNLEGILNGDFHVVQTPDEMTVSSSVYIDSMVYEGNPMGDLGSEFTYMPRPDGGHYVDGIFIHDGTEVGVLNGTYFSSGKGVLDAQIDLNRFPMDLANGFIPDKIIGFKGYAEGSLSIRGSLSSPDVNGEVYLDSTYMFSEPYGVEMRFANDPVTIQNSRLLLENFEMFAHNDSPLNIQGYFDFSDTERMNMNMRMRAENYLLVDSKETARSDAYGKAYVNFYGTMQGLLDNLRMRGRLEVLGNTDLKYILKDSPLSNDNQLEGLVEFVDFNDTTTQVINRPPLTGLDMDLSINIDEGVHVNCFLNADHSNYIDVVGGGDMRLIYNMVDDVRLTGRYTIGEGEMKYSLPIIPLKTFTIEDDSYIQFRGDPMNPALNLTATEETKANVGATSGNERVVKFTSGVIVTKTLQDMGLEFIIDAPEDMTIHNQLQAMSKEERGKMAVAMLTTGMYLADGSTAGFDMNSALSAFLNSQINQISGKALRTLDVSFGVDNSFTDTGDMHTDYSFKFAKRFWNNRLRIIVGGKLSSGAEMPNENDTFFDNVTFEYRLSPTSSKYLTLFYKRNDYDWLEGEVSKFGAGFMWKRKLRHFKDIFRSDKNDERMRPLRNNSIKQDTIKRDTLKQNRIKRDTIKQDTIK